MKGLMVQQHLGACNIKEHTMNSRDTQTMLLTCSEASDNSDR